jgi:hypothetical protein
MFSITNYDSVGIIASLSLFPTIPWRCLLFIGSRVYLSVVGLCDLIFIMRVLVVESRGDIVSSSTRDL